MREQHPNFDRDVAADDALWRYMDLPKFVSMLKEKALYFCRADLLGDPLEGSFTRAREIERQRFLQNPPEGRTREDLERVFEHNLRIMRSGAENIYVNCWHRGAHESMAHWNIPGFDATGATISPSGLFVPVDLQTLVTDVVVSPLAPKWFEPIIQVTGRQFGFEFTIRSSLASAAPVY